MPVGVHPPTEQAAEKKPDPAIWRLAPITIKLETQPPQTRIPPPTTEASAAASCGPLETAGLPSTGMPPRAAAVAAAVAGSTVSDAARGGSTAAACAQTCAQTCAPLADDPFHFDWPYW